MRDLASAYYLLSTALLVAMSSSGCRPTGRLPKEAPDPHPAAAAASSLLAPETDGAPEDVEPVGSADGFLGVVLPRRSVEVAAESGGRLLEVVVRVGDVLERGDPIARLDSRLVAEELRMGQASLRALRADAEQRRAELEDVEGRTARRLKAPELFSREDLDTARRELKAARAALDAAEAEVAGAESRVDQLEERVGDTVLRAPFSGTVSRRYVDAGAILSPGDPVVRFIAAEDFLVRFAVPPGDAIAFAPGSKVEVRVTGAAGALDGRVERIAPEIDSASGMIFIEARLAVSGGPGDAPSAGAVARVMPSAS